MAVLMRQGVTENRNTQASGSSDSGEGARAETHEDMQGHRGRLMECDSQGVRACGYKMRAAEDNTIQYDSLKGRAL